MHEGESLSILPKEDKFSVTVNGKIVPIQHTIELDWIHVDLIDEKLWAMVTTTTGSSIIYNGDQLQVEMIKMNVEFFGKCMKK